MMKNILILLFCFGLSACSHSPLLVNKEQKIHRGFFSGFKKRNISYSTLQNEGDYLYVSSREGALYKYDGKKGQRLWKLKLEGPIDADPWISGKTIFAATAVGNVYKINQDMNKPNVIWKKALGENFYGSMASFNDLVLVQTTSMKLMALESSSGKIRWTYERDSSLDLNLGILGKIQKLDGERIIVPFADGSLVTLSIKNGLEESVREFSGKTRFSSIVSFSSLGNSSRWYAGQYQGQSELIKDKADGTYWEAKKSGSAAKVFLAGKSVFIPLTNGKIEKRSLASGDLEWSYESKTAGAAWSGLTQWGSFLLASDYAGRMEVIDLSKGELIWTYRFHKAIQGAPILIGNQAWVLTKEGLLQSFKLNSSYQK